MAALPNRDCGPCTACCTYLPIRTDTLDKPTNVVCPHCVEGRGCTVYAIRPTVCADWLCGWKTMAEIPDDWRPSDSGIMFRDEDMPDREMTIALLDSTPRRLPAKLAELAATWHTRGIAIYLQTFGPPGHYPTRHHMNPLIAKAVAAKDTTGVLDVFTEALEHLRTEHIWDPDHIPLESRVLR